MWIFFLWTAHVSEFVCSSYFSLIYSLNSHKVQFRTPLTFLLHPEKFWLVSSGAPRLVSLNDVILCQYLLRFYLQHQIVLRCFKNNIVLNKFFPANNPTLQLEILVCKSSRLISKRKTQGMKKKYKKRNKFVILEWPATIVKYRRKHYFQFFFFLSEMLDNSCMLSSFAWCYDLFNWWSKT